MSNGVTIIALLLAGYAAFDLVKALRSGKARGRVGSIHRKTRPVAFRTYIIGDAAVIFLALVAALWNISQR